MRTAACGIFHDPEREYCYLSRVMRYRRVSGGACFSVLTNRDEPMTLDIRFLTPHVVRVLCRRSADKPLVDSPDPAANVNVEARGGRILIRSEALELRVVRRPFHFGVFDFAGNKLFVQQIGDVEGDRLISMPLGSARASDGRIAFHESFELQSDERLFRSDQSGVDVRGQSFVAAASSLILSSRGYGVVARHSSRTTWELGFPSSITCSFRVDDPYLNYLLLFGDGPKQILARFTALSSSTRRRP